MTAPDHPRALLLGLDGAGFPVLDRLAGEGVMPFLTSLRARGASGVLASTPHPISPAAWASVMTGRSPGSHGVFDFVRVDHALGRPAYSLVTSHDLRGDTVFEIASRQGRRVTALNFPCMFPPPQVDGCVVPGYVPWSYLGRACHPRDLYGRLKAEAGLDPRRLAVDWELERTAVQGVEEDELAHWVSLHIERDQQWFAILRHLMRTEPADLTAVVFDGVDRIQHLCLHLVLADEASGASARARDLCLEYFRRLDGYLEGIVAQAGPETTVLVVSDHGARTAGDRIFNANVWLERQGLLRWAATTAADGDGRLGLDGNTESATLFDWDHTFAAALTSSSNAITVHRSAGPGSPGVLPEDQPAFCRRLADLLLDAVDPATGERLVERVLLRDETFPGPASSEAPDLTLVLRSPGFLSVLRGHETTAARRAPYGTHDPDGILVAAGPGVAPGRRLPEMSVVDVAPTLLYALGLGIPDDVEGHPVLDAFETSFVDLRPVHADLTPVLAGAPAHPRGALDAEAEAQVVERLRSLGYLE